MKRRNFLKSLAASTALPLLGSASNASAAPGDPPKRVIYIFLPVGYYESNILPQAQGKMSSFGSLPYALEPLAQMQTNQGNSILDQCTLISNVDNAGAMWGKRKEGLDAHLGGTVSALSAGLLRQDGGGYKCAISADQVFAQNQANSRSYQIGIVAHPYGFSNGREGGIGSGSPRVDISWAGERQPLGLWTDQRAVFDDIFHDLAPGTLPPMTNNRQKLRQWMDQRAMMYAKSERVRLDPKISVADKLKLDQYLASVEALIKQLAAQSGMMTPPPPMCGAPPKPTEALIEEMRDRNYLNYEQYVDNWMQMMVMGLQCQRASAFAFAFGSGASNMIYTRKMAGSIPPLQGSSSVSGLPSVSDSRFHELSHHTQADYLPHLRIIDNWHVRQFGKLIQMLANVPEGNGTLLDNTMVMMVPELSESNLHVCDRLNVLAAGGGLFKKGHHVKLPENNRQLGSLHMTVLKKLGITNLSTFGHHDPANGIEAKEVSEIYA